MTRSCRLIATAWLHIIRSRGASSAGSSILIGHCGHLWCVYCFSLGSVADARDLFDRLMRLLVYAQITIRTPGTVAGINNLAIEDRVYVDFLDNTTFGKRDRYASADLRQEDL